MIEINLLPGAKKAKRSGSAKFDFGAAYEDVSSRIRDPYLIGAVAGVVVAILAVGGMWAYQNRRVSALTVREQKAVQDSVVYSGLIAQRTAALAQRDAIVRQISIIKAIDGTRYVWPHVLEEVSRSLQPYIWLKAITQTSAVPSLATEVEGGSAAGQSKAAAPADSAALAVGTLAFRIVGQTVDIQALTRFMKELDASAWIENVNLAKTDIVLVQPGNKEATEFTLDMKLQKPDSAKIRLVPLTLGVR